ncbi:Uncharacterized protein Fot_24916 [Forsythia ovata]|uniref:Uncharacterized protein n=1 Tax=Forsythia ovata TaxID=205694 RepID=A0ABD1U7J5_9LAMI
MDHRQNRNRGRSVFYTKGMKKETTEDQYKYDVIFMNDPTPSTSKGKELKTDKGKAIAHNIETLDPLHGQTFPNKVKMMLSEPANVLTSNKRQNKEDVISIGIMVTKKNDEISPSFKDKNKGPRRI